MLFIGPDKKIINKDIDKNDILPTFEKYIGSTATGSTTIDFSPVSPCRIIKRSPGTITMSIDQEGTFVFERFQLNGRLLETCIYPQLTRGLLSLRTAGAATGFCLRVTWNNQIFYLTDGL